MAYLMLRNIANFSTIHTSSQEAPLLAGFAGFFAHATRVHHRGIQHLPMSDNNIREEALISPPDKRS